MTRTLFLLGMVTGMLPLTVVVMVIAQLFATYLQPSYAELLTMGIVIGFWTVVVLGLWGAIGKWLN